MAVLYFSLKRVKGTDTRRPVCSFRNDIGRRNNVMWNNGRVFAHVQLETWIPRERHAK